MIYSCLYPIFVKQRGGGGEFVGLWIERDEFMVFIKSGLRSEFFGLVNNT